MSHKILSIHTHMCAVDDPINGNADKDSKKGAEDL